MNTYAVQAQNLLNSHGYDCGPPDGIIGPQFLKCLTAALEGQPGGGQNGRHALRDPAKFFADVRARFGKLDVEQVKGFEILLRSMERWRTEWVAYGLATAWHETNKTMQPVAEAYFLGANAEAWRKKNLRYWPWYGRGYPQTTWEVNYQRADDALGLGGKLMKNPDLMMTPEVAAPTMVRGMAEGWFTGKKLADFGPLDYVGMRKIINGTDDDDLIAGHARTFEAALTAGGWS